MDLAKLQKIAEKLVAPKKGILAADESTGTIKKRFDSIGVASTEETRRQYREMLFSTPGIEEYISGVILFDETIRQRGESGQLFPDLLQERGIIPGIKVDKGKIDMPNFPGEKVTEGLDGLRERLIEYRGLGAMFAKWRAVFSISDKTPTDTCIYSNADSLARYATLCQEQDIVPIVEPEVLTDGGHGIEKSEEVTYKVLKKVFERLSSHKVHFEGMLLKPNWVHHGKDAEEKASNDEIVEATLRVMKEVVPSEVPGLVFLSGGDSAIEATGHIDRMNELGKDAPWEISFSFGRALQRPALEAWQGKKENVKAAQDAFYKRARLDSLARTGEYDVSMESDD